MMSTLEKEELMQQVDSALDTVRPHLKEDGGDVELVDITDDLMVKVKWLGNCQSCSMSIMTMKAGLEMTIRSQLPQISGVMAINGLN
ncbi:MAG: NifU family protein [Saprospiraceae bacterium]